MKKLLFLLVVLLATQAVAKITYVPQDQSTIQDGIDNSLSGDTVFIAAGTYDQRLVVDKALTLLGQARGTVTITGGDPLSTVTIRHDSVTLEQLTIKGGGSADMGWGLQSGVLIADADYCRIEYCWLSQNAGTGIHIGAGSHNVVRHCMISDCSPGIQLSGWDFDSTVSWQCQYNEITNNLIVACQGTGIRIGHYGSWVQYSTIRSNMISQTEGPAISAVTSDHNEFSYNYLWYNTGVGLYLSHCMCGGDQNEIHHNSFIENGLWEDGIQAMEDGALTEYWYSPTGNEGNFWYDYTGSDADSDGIGDTPYEITYASGRSDPYPLMAFEDSDGDDIPDSVDMCPELASGWSDNDGDWVGNECDPCSDADFDGIGDPQTSSPECPGPDNCYQYPNPDQEDSDGDGVGDSCDFRNPLQSAVWTNLVNLAIENDGSMGVKGESGYTMDYHYATDDCEDTYLYDGAPLILTTETGDTVLSWSMYDNRTVRLPGWGLEPAAFNQISPDYSEWRSGCIVSSDFTVGLEKIWYVPAASAANRQFLIQGLRIFSFDDYMHPGVTVGEIVDWDIPAGTGSDNVACYDEISGLITQQGTGDNCYPNDLRFGGVMPLSAWLNDDCITDQVPYIHGSYVARNDSSLWYATPEELCRHMAEQGHQAVTDTADLHTVLTYIQDYSLMPGDTLAFYTAFATTQATDSSGHLEYIMNVADEFLESVLGLGCSCCQGIRGDMNGDGAAEPDITDLVFVVASMFGTGPQPPCIEEADVNGDGSGASPDIADLVVLVTYMFQGGPPPADCP